MEKIIVRFFDCRHIKYKVTMAFYQQSVFPPAAIYAYPMPFPNQEFYAMYPPGQGVSWFHDFFLFCFNVLKFISNYIIIIIFLFCRAWMDPPCTTRTTTIPRINQVMPIVRSQPTPVSPIFLPSVAENPRLFRPVALEAIWMKSPSWKMSRKNCHQWRYYICWEMNSSWITKGAIIYFFNGRSPSSHKQEFLHLTGVLMEYFL